MIDFDKLSIADIKRLIAEGIVTNDEVIEFYGNEWWDDNEETEYDEYYIANN